MAQRISIAIQRGNAASVLRTRRIVLIWNMIISGIISTLAAFVLGTFNLMAMVLCLFLFSLSLWAISSPSTLSTAMQVAGDPAYTALLPEEVLTVQNGVSSAALAIFLFIIAFMGLYGAVTRSQYVLCMYSSLVLLLLLLECALTYYFSSTLIEKGLQEQDGQWTHALRLVFRCCDIKNITEETLKPPWSCCGADFYPENCTASSIYEKDCQATITEWIDRYITAVYASLAVLHLVLASCALLRRCSRSYS